MAANFSNLYSVLYASAVELLAQQMTPRVASTFTPMAGEGKSATVVNQIDAFEADERSALYDPVVFGEPTHTRPWVYPRHFDKALPFDSIEAMQSNANPQSEYVQGVVAAINRKMDDEAIRAFFADRNVGEAGTTTDSFAAGYQVGVSGGGTTSGRTTTDCAGCATRGGCEANSLTAPRESWSWRPPLLSTLIVVCDSARSLITPASSETPIGTSA